MSATAQLLTDLAEHLVAQGTPVTVITSRLAYDAPAVPLPPREVINGVAVHRVWTTRFGRAGLWGRAVDYLSFYLAATWALFAVARPGDTVLAKTDPPLMSIPAAFVRRFRRARLVNWCQDLFPEIAASVGFRWTGGPLGRILMRLRNRSLRRADVNVVLNQSMRAHLLAQSVPDDRIRVIHNWPHAGLAPIPRRRASDRLLHAPELARQQPEPFCICYSGNLGRVHNVDSIIDFIARTATVRNIAFRFVGGGVGHARLQAAIAEHGWSHITFEPYAPRHLLNDSLARCDAHLITLDPACEGLIQPSKIYGILACGRPAIFIGAAGGGIARLLERHDAGLALDIRRPDTWRPAIAGLIDDPTAVERMGTAAHAAYQSAYTPAHAFAAWQDVLLPAPVVEPVLAPAALPIGIPAAELVPMAEPVLAEAYVPARAGRRRRTAA